MLMLTVVTTLTSGVCRDHGIHFWPLAWEAGKTLLKMDLGASLIIKLVCLFLQVRDDLHVMGLLKVHLFDLIPCLLWDHLQQ